MKFHSDYSEKYARDICDALNNEESGKFTKLAMIDRFTPETFGSFTEFLQLTVVMIPNVFHYLDERRLVNTGRCPYMGTRIDDTSPSWSYVGRFVHVSKEGAKIMQKEFEEDFDRLIL